MTIPLLWLDLETTGLDPQRDQILEIAYGVATLEEPFVLVAPMVSRVFSGWPNDRTDPFVVGMHLRNNLWAECAEAETFAESYDAHLASVIADLKDDGDTDVILAGSTIHFDKAFLAHWMPKACALLSHRLYDVSAIKLFCQSLGMPKILKGEAHRAKADVLESVAHARQCAEWLGRSEAAE